MNQNQPDKRSPVSQVFTQAIQTVHAQFLTLKPRANVPELRIKNGKEKKIRKYPLINDRCSIGRSSRNNDIVLRNSLISQVHVSIERDRAGNYHVKDEDSLNGIYLGKRKQSSFQLHHGKKFTLGPPDVADAVEITYHSPPPIFMRSIFYGAYAMGGIAIIVVILIGIEWTKFSVRPLPTGVQGPVIVYSRNGQTPLRPLPTGTHHELKELSDFSPYLSDAVIASEDTRFYWHFGIDPIGILRAAIINFSASEFRQGASTLTQQLARSLYPEYVGRENTIERKLREMIVALKLEAFYSKDKLLLTYLNRVYLGVGSYGFEDAAQFYFDKSARDLNLSEAATLVAILPAPNAYNPVQDYETAMQLRDRVINRMAKLSMITEEEANRARRSRIEVSPKARQNLSQIRAPYFYNHVLLELKNLLGSELAAEGNFILETTLDLDQHAIAEKTLQDNLDNQGTYYGYKQGAMVTLDSTTGAILSLVGGKSYKESQFNRVTQAQRQPGSTFKVFAYAAALEQGISPHKTYSCAPLTWRGQRYQGCQRSSGKISLAQAMAQSENVVALRVAQEVGLNQVVAMAQRLGIDSPLDPVPGLILGQSEVNVLEMTGAYAVFDNKGVKKSPHAIARIFDGGDCDNPENYETCRVIYNYRERGQQVISPQIAATMTQWLQGVVREGTGRAARIGENAAGKTGTTNDGVDLWFIGYLPNKNLTTGVWLGNDQPSPTQGSSTQAAQLWGNYIISFLTER